MYPFPDQTTWNPDPPQQHILILLKYGSTPPPDLSVQTVFAQFKVPMK